MYVAVFTPAQVFGGTLQPVVNENIQEKGTWRLEYVGVQSIEKMSLFLLTDILSYYATNKYKEIFWDVKETPPDIEAIKQPIKSIVREIAESQFKGMVADQISKRIDNSIAKLMSANASIKSGEHNNLKNNGTAATSMTDQQKDVLEASFAWWSNNDKFWESPSLFTQVKGGSCPNFTKKVIRDILSNNERHNTTFGGQTDKILAKDVRYVPTLRLARWLINNYLKVSGDRRHTMTNIYAMEFSRKIRESRTKNGEHEKSEYFRFIDELSFMGLALKCILLGAEGSEKGLGGLYKSVFSCSNLKALFDKSLIIKRVDRANNNIIVMGPPGSGKTLFIKLFAQWEGQIGWEVSGVERLCDPTSTATRIRFQNGDEEFSVWDTQGVEIWHDAIMQITHIISETQLGNYVILCFFGNCKDNESNPCKPILEAIDFFSMKPHALICISQDGGMREGFVHAIKFDCSVPDIKLSDESLCRSLNDLDRLRVFGKDFIGNDKIYHALTTITRYATVDLFSTECLQEIFTKMILRHREGERMDATDIVDFLNALSNSTQLIKGSNDVGKQTMLFAAVDYLGDILQCISPDSSSSLDKFRESLDGVFANSVAQEEFR